MAYIPITNAQVDPDSPVTAELMTQLRDNPLEMFAGAAGAPRVQPGAMPHIWTAGAIGSMVWATRVSGTASISFGGTVAGSNIAPTGAIYGTTKGSQAPPANMNMAIESPLSGSWRCLGVYTHTSTVSGGDEIRGASLFVRIS